MRAWLMPVEYGRALVHDRFPSVAVYLDLELEQYVAAAPPDPRSSPPYEAIPTSMSMTHSPMPAATTAGPLQHGRRRRRLIQWQRLVFLTVVSLSLSRGDAATAAVGTFDAQTCTKCAGLQYCTIMNGQYLFDPIAGYSRAATTQLEKQGGCEDLDAKTLALSPFGTQLQFKDTTACHTLVWNFHCLSWVATTFQRQVNGTAVSCAQTGSATVPLPPCRSLCVEVADKCVYSQFYRLYLDEVCGNIKCLTEIQEAKDTGTANTNVAETTCVSGSWVYSKNNTFSRCSTRAYEPPAALAARDGVCGIVVTLGMLNMLWLM